jgi:pyruvate/2-oxoglutarate dehydrogenase complex dihydrolipoamide acyltransferase (E2) component
MIAENMVKSKNTIPHYGYVDECDVTELVRLREALKEPTSKKNIRLTYLAFAVKAVATALKQVPSLTHRWTKRPRRLSCTTVTMSASPWPHRKVNRARGP